MAIITFTTDFGCQDSYVAEMKGLVLCGIPSAQLVDITHDIPKFDIAAGARVLARAIPAFPDGSIHVAVVDPGVGSSRRRIAAEVQCAAPADRKMFFVGPDNGLLSACRAPEFSCLVHEITNTDLIPGITQHLTFDGRDVFTPAAVLLAKGVKLCELGPVIEDAVVLDSIECRAAENTLYGEVVYIDTFGNLITNIGAELLHNREGILRCEVEGHELPLVPSYQALPEDEAGMLVNSDSVIEIAVNRGSAAKALRLGAGARVQITFIGGSHSASAK